MTLPLILAQLPVPARLGLLVGIDSRHNYQAIYHQAGRLRAVLGIRDILVRIRGSVPLTIGPGSGSNSGFLQ